MTSRRSVRAAVAWVALLGLAVGASVCSSDDDSGDEPAADEASDEPADEPADDGTDDAADEPGDEEPPEDLTAELEAAQARADAAEEELATSQEELATQIAAATEASEQVTQLTNDLATETERADAAEQELTDISELFPITVDSALDGFDVAGTYNLTWAEAYCDTFDRCGTTPATHQVTIATTPEGWLELQVPNMFTIALFAVQGSLYGVTDSTAVLPPCGDTPQVARITVTAYADGVTVQSDGTRTVEKLGSAVTISGSFAPGCSGGTIFYGAELVRA